MKQITLFYTFCIVLTHTLWAQPHWDYLGGGHDRGITVTTSHQKDENHGGEKSIDGFPVSRPSLLKDAARFLNQATLGADYETIQMVSARGFDSWLEEQFNLRQHSVRKNGYLIKPLIDEEMLTPNSLHSLENRLGWWHTVMTAPGMLRQRLALALSEIFVVSDRADALTDEGDGLGSYYDMLAENALGNYRDLLFEVTIHPAMGVYLSHISNPKADPERNTHPDENYAREVMQLFSIGLYELNQDGSRKLDDRGNFIPTYNNGDISEFAKVFTGLSDGSERGQFGVLADPDNRVPLFTNDMDMYPFFHQAGDKKLLNQVIIPDGQSGQEDIESAMDNLFNHPNVGPFIGKALIQFLVTSNPSPEYINRVATIFDQDEMGNRGNLKAVIKAILMDEEARQCNETPPIHFGKLREPILRYVQVAKAFNAFPNYDLPAFINIGRQYNAATAQFTLSSPSVFNFFLPEYQPNGAIANAQLVAPEFQIHNTNTAIGYINMADQWTFHNGLTHFLIDDFIPGRTLTDLGRLGASTLPDLSEEFDLANDPSALVNRINILLAGGQLSNRTQSIIIDAISQLTEPEQRVDMAMYLTLISPDYAIQK